MSDKQETTQEVPKADARDPVVSVRVPPSLLEMIDAQRDGFPGPDGKPSSRSGVLRAMLKDGLLVADRELIAAIDRARGDESRQEYIRRVLEEATEDEPPSPFARV